MDQIILTEVKNKVGHIILNSPKSLNSLSLPMAKALLATLGEWANDENVEVVVLKGSGEKAFCAGGDVVSLYHSMTEAFEAKSENKKALEFFLNEYTLDYSIHTYKKPIVCLGHGIVMGGGIGLMNGCSHRVVTEKTMLAMPEITIGLYPDVGGTYFLSRLPEHQGKFLALTGARMNAGDCLETKMADYFVSVENLSALEADLDSVTNKMELENLLNSYHEKSTSMLPESNLVKHDKTIKELMRESDLKKLKSELESKTLEDKWLSKSIQSFVVGCPTSAALIKEQLERGKTMGLKDVFKMELNMSMGCVNNGEFHEGVRALLIDKDNSPKWNPTNYDQIQDSVIASHFEAEYGDLLNNL